MPVDADAVDVTLPEKSAEAHTSASLAGDAASWCLPGDARRPLPSLKDVQSVLATRDLGKLKTLLRNNSWPVCHEDREYLWRFLAYGTNLKSDGIFTEYATKLFPASEQQSDDNGNDIEVKDLACDRANHYFLSAAGARSVRRVLMVLGETNPHIGEFSFHLYAFTSILKHYLLEEHCFDSLYAMLKCKSVDYFLTPSELSLQASAYVLCDLAYLYIKPTAVYLERRCVDCNLHNFCCDWLLWLFQYLPFVYVIRMTDCYLVEGYKVLYRIALALMLIYHKVSAKRGLSLGSTEGEAGMKVLCTTIDQVVSAEKLLQIGFAIRGFTRKQLAKLFVRSEQILQKAVANGLVGKAKYVKPTSAFGKWSSIKSSIRRPHANLDSGDMKSSVHLAHEEPSSAHLSRNNQRSFKFDHAIYSHIDLGMLGSTILSKYMVAKLWGWLPELQAVRDPLLIFTTELHGYSIKRFYERSEGHGPTLLLIRAVSGEVFGAYCSTDWCERQKSIDAGAQISYFGTGESFVFSLEPEARCYPWVGRSSTSADGTGDVVIPKSTAHMFMAADNSMFTVGGGGGTALQVDENLDRGHSSFCDTFENAPLCGGGSQFQVQTLEAIVFH